jgi:hypothetical protein
MTDLAEVRKSLNELRDIAVATANDVGWIKGDMVRGTQRMDTQDGRIRTLENRQHWWSGVAVVVGAAISWIVGYKIT